MPLNKETKFISFIVYISIIIRNPYLIKAENISDLPVNESVRSPNPWLSY